MLCQYAHVTQRVASIQPSRVLMRRERPKHAKILTDASTRTLKAEIIAWITRKSRKGRSRASDGPRTDAPSRRTMRRTAGLPSGDRKAAVLPTVMALLRPRGRAHHLSLYEQYEVKPFSVAMKSGLGVDHGV